MKTYKITLKTILITFIFIFFNILSGIIFFNSGGYGHLIFITLLFLTFILTTFFLSKVVPYTCSSCNRNFRMWHSQFLSTNVNHVRKLKCPYCRNDTWCKPYLED